MIDELDINKINEIIKTAEHIVIIQADNPDADSVGSALAFEELLGELGKKTTLYCGTDMPSYLSYISGIDRVMSDMPKSFDASIIVDASTKSLLQKLNDAGELSWVAAKPCIVIDHHDSVQDKIDFAEVMIVDGKAASTSAIIYKLCEQNSWPISKSAAESMLVSILGDTQGLTNSLAGAETYRIVAELIDNGANRPELEERRRKESKMTREILRYKGRLIERAKFAHDDRLVTVVIPQMEIETYSPLYNPAPLVQGDFLQTKPVEIAIVLKVYDSGRVTGSIRCNNSTPIANVLAENFGGGGHAFAAGFKQEKVQNSSELINEVISKVGELLEAQS
jgi:bifunctional oligoribonuclease and PAP phosphatase NrnA